MSPKVLGAFQKKKKKKRFPWGDQAFLEIYGVGCSTLGD